VFHTYTLVITKSLGRLITKVYEIHEHLVIALLTAFVNLEEMFEKFFVVGVTLLDEHLGQKDSFPVVRHYHAVFVVLKQVNNRIEKCQSNLFYCFNRVSFLLMFKIFV
jgi:hypothetical protein